MNKKQLIIAAMATVLSVGAANATSNITGYSQTSGTFDIYAAKVNGSVGYRAYDNFQLGQGDTANLNFWSDLRDASTGGRNLDTFINLVQGQINVQGALNTVRNGNFYNGHAVFVSPNGMVIGSSGVLNVGRLSVITPTSTKFNTLKNEYDADNFENINQVSQMKHLDTSTNGITSGNGAINVQGYIFSRNGVDLPGSNVTVSGKILNGLADSSTKFSGSTAASAAETLFNSLVNTDGTVKANAAINSNGSLVFLNAKQAVNVSGSVVNMTQGTNKGGVALTAGNGMSVSGNVTSNGKLSLYNKGGSTSVTGKLQNKNGELSVTNSSTASDMTISSDALIKNTAGDVYIVNNGSGLLQKAGTASATGELGIINEAGGATVISGTTESTGANVRIVNRANGLTVNGTVSGNTDVSIRNYGQDGYNKGITLGATVNANNGILVDNSKGSMAINGTLDSEGNVAVYNRATAGALTTGDSSRIEGRNIVSIKNASSGGMELNGTVRNTGDGSYVGTGTSAKHETAINNLAGAMTINGTVDNKGNMGIINKGAGKMTLNADIDNDGKLKLANVNGSGFDLNETVDNQNGNLSIYNEKGLLTVNGKVNNDGGYLFVLSRKSSDGVKTTAGSELVTTGTATSGVNVPQLAIKHNGSGTTNGYGLDLNGKVANNSTSGQVAINNYKGNTHVGGTVTANNSMGIINRTGSGNMTVDATITQNGTNSTTNIKNYANTGNMTVAGTINHKGRLNILANDGTLTLDGTINNNGSGMTYAIARAGSDGFVTTANSEVTSPNGMVWFRNRGANGLTHNGSIVSTNAQAELQNYAGNLTVNGTVTGSPAAIINNGAQLIVTDDAVLVNDMNSTKLINQGTVAGNIANKYRDIYKENLNSYNNRGNN